MHAFRVFWCHEDVQHQASETYVLLQNAVILLYVGEVAQNLQNHPALFKQLYFWDSLELIYVYTTEDVFFLCIILDGLEPTVLVYQINDWIIEVEVRIERKLR